MIWKNSNINKKTKSDQIQIHLIAVLTSAICTVNWLWFIMILYKIIYIYTEGTSSIKYNF